MSPSHGRSDTQKVSPTRLPKHEPNKDDTDKSVRMDGGKLGGPQSHTKFYRQLRHAESGRNSLAQGRAHRLAVQYQAVSPENIHMGSIKQTEQVTCKNKHAYTYNLVTTVNDKRGHDLKNSKERFIRWKKGKGEVMTIL